MDILLTWIGIASGLMLLVAVTVAWWEHRQRLADLHRSLVDAENSRSALEERVREVDLRLDALNSTLESHKEALAATRDTHERRATLDGALQRMTGASAEGPAETAPGPNSTWPDTQPMVQSADPAQAAAAAAEHERHLHHH